MTDEKPLEKYTVKQLREMARDMEGIEGVSVMKKDELIAAMQAITGTPAKETKTKAPKKKAPPSVETIATVKEKIQLLKEKREEYREKRDKVAVYRLKRRISRLKKRSRKMARSAAS